MIIFDRRGEWGGVTKRSQKVIIDHRGVGGSFPDTPPENTKKHNEITSLWTVFHYGKNQVIL